MNLNEDYNGEKLDKGEEYNNVVQQQSFTNVLCR